MWLTFLRTGERRSLIVLLLLFFLLLVSPFPCIKAITGSCIGGNGSSSDNFQRPYHRMMFSYATISGFAISSLHWKRVMQKELQQMAVSSTRAITLQQVAAQNQVEAEEFAAKSVAEQEESYSLQQQGEMLVEKGQVDETEAVLEQQEGQALGLQATGDEAESASLIAESTAQEAIVEEDLAKGVVDAAIATEDESAVGVDEVVAGACQLIPVLDAVCDVVGGIAGVGLQTAASRQAALAVEDYATAAAAQISADAKFQQATELQAKSVKEAQESAALLAEADELQVQGDEEVVQGRAEQVAAEQEAAQSVVDKESAVEEQAQAVVEEDAAAMAWKEAMQHGVLAFWNAILSIFSNVICLLFCVILIVKYIIARTLVNRRTCGGGGRQCGGESNSTTTSTRIAVTETMSHFFHHVLFMTMFFGLWGEKLLLLQQQNYNDVMIRNYSKLGEILLMMAMTTAATQAFFLHSVPLMLRQQQQQQDASYSCCCPWSWTISLLLLYNILREFCRRFFVLFILMVLEILIIAVNVGEWVVLLEPKVIQALQQPWYLWMILLSTTLSLHYYHHYYYIHSAQQTSTKNELFAAEECCRVLSHHNHDKKNEIVVDLIATVHLLKDVDTEQPVMTDYGSCPIGIESKEDPDDEDTCNSFSGSITRASLLSQTFVTTTATTQSVKSCCDSKKYETCDNGDEWFHQQVLADFKRLHVLLIMEILLASVMLTLLRKSMPTMIHLWSTCKSMILNTTATHSQWYYVVAVVVAVFAVLGLVAVMICACP